MAKITVDEIVTLLSFETSKGTAKSIASVKKGVKSLTKLAVVSTGAITGLAFAMNKILGGVDKQAKFAAGIGVSLENLQKLQFASKKAGASAEELNSFLATLAKTVTSTDPGGYNKVLIQLGVKATDANGKIIPLVTTLLSLSDALKAKDPIRRQQFGSKLGTSVNLTNLLGQGSDKILEEMRKASRIGAVIPERSKRAAKEFNESFIELKATITGFSRVLSVALAPQLTKIIKSFQDWILTNKELIATNVVSFVSDLVSVLKNLKIVLIVLSPLLVAWVASMAAAAAPFLALGGAIALVVMNLDKLKSMAEAVGRVMGKAFPGVFSALADEISIATDVLKSFLKVSKDVRGALSVFTIFGLEKVTNKLNEVGDLFDLTSSAKGASRFPILEARTAAASNTVNNDVTINVNGSQSPRATAVEVRRQLELSNAVHTASPGFNRPMVG